MNWETTNSRTCPNLTYPTLKFYDNSICEVDPKTGPQGTFPKGIR